MFADTFFNWTDDLKSFGKHTLLHTDRQNQSQTELACQICSLKGLCVGYFLQSDDSHTHV